ncbi:MAG: prolyl oligopeptidase family serine peptidase, partial [Chloroflexi bacterium]|nr:prolyl oligopeptidase family serine peptidase [Chloroflexota bacterium]
MDDGQTMSGEAWERRYRAPKPMWSRVARRARERGLVGTNPDGIYQLYAWQVETGELRPITSAPQGVLFGVISPDGRYVFYHTDEGGNELGHWVRVPFEAGEPESLSPELPPYFSFSLGVSGDSRRTGFSRATPEGFIVSLVDEVGGQLTRPREIFRSSALTVGPILSWDGALAAVMSNECSTGGPEYCLLVLDADRGQRLAELWDGEGTSVEFRMYSPVDGDDRILGRSNTGGTFRPLVWNPRNGERLDLAVDRLDGDVSPLDWSSDGRSILLGQIHQARQFLHVYDLESGTLHSLTGRGGTWGWLLEMVAYFGPDGEILAHWQDATHPEALVALDPAGNVVRTVLPAGEVPPSHPWRSISFASQGQEIQGWLCVPDGDGPFPTILHTHGGPFLATMESFSPECQAFVDAGFAFCTINYRGSTTFGRDFQEVIVGAPGHQEVADIMAARDWLVEHGV